MTVRTTALGLAALCVLTTSTAAGQDARLLRRPAVSADLVAFAHGADLWVVSRAGGPARRLTSTPEVETDPSFSPDGSRVAYTATVAGNTDVYVMPTAGGQPTRLTYHPGLDAVRGWTRDGRHVVFGSVRTSAPQLSYLRLWRVGPEGGLPEPLAPPRAYSGAFSPDGGRLAFLEMPMTPMAEWAQEQSSQWRHYRGGHTHPIRIMDLSDHSVEELPWGGSVDSHPMWIGDTVYFLSDRNHTINLFSWDAASRQVRQLTHHDDYDIMSASAGPDAIVYEQAGYVHLFEPSSGRSTRLPIEVRGDFAWARPRMEKVAATVREASLSPTGVRAAFEARGEIFSVPVEKGDWRNLTGTPGVHERDPSWSPDGTRLAWFSDASGEYRLVIGDPLGLSEPRVVGLPTDAFFSEPAWSPDGRSILLRDNHLNLWTIDVGSGRPTRIDSDTYEDPGRALDAVWSPDSRWIAYSKALDSHLRAIFVHSLADGTTRQLTDGLSDAIAPVFDAGGRYLYFLASTNFGLRTGWLNMSSLDRPVTRSIYLAVLRSGEPSPLLPELGEEPGTVPDGPDAVGAAAVTDTADVVRIDFDGVDQRIIALNVPEGDYEELRAGPAGTVYYLAAAAPEPGSRSGPSSLDLYRYRLSERSPTRFLDGVRSYGLSRDGSKLLYRAARGAPERRWGVVATDGEAEVGDGLLDVASLETRVEPEAEWAQIFRETWRIQREYFYDPEMQGADWDAVYAKYLPFLPHVRHRDDLGYLVATVGGELAVGHSYLTGPGDVPVRDPVRVGLLGADLEVANGRYRIRRIYTGENWNPELRAPLSAPGIEVAEGDYLLEVNGRPLVPPTNPYSLFEGTADRQTLIRVGPTPSPDGSRLLTALPVASEAGLRMRAWVEDNRRRVDELSGGRLAYVWLPNTATEGYQFFNRYYYAQQDRQGAVIDERYNQGGMVADYIIAELSRPLTGYFAQRVGKTSTSPMQGLFGPKVMIINESAGSGGDALPYMFKLLDLGPLVGTRTWGGLVGTLGTPETIDGGGITAPSLGFYDLEGRWAVENEGVTPDIEVEYSAEEVLRGRDPQLERAVQEALRLLDETPLRHPPRPASIDRVSRRPR